MSQVPDAWTDEWSNVADKTSTGTSSSEPNKKVSSKVSKAQKRAQQAEFNRQLWAEAEGPRPTNYFLESRNVVPLRQEYKAPPILLSRKGPIVQSPRPPTGGIEGLKLKDDSSEDDDETRTRELTLAERQAQAAKDREEKQRKYEERRLELFGPQNNIVPPSKSGNSSPGSGTPPHSRSSTPSRGGKRVRGRGNNASNNQPRGQQSQPSKELFDASYMPRPESLYAQRREQGTVTPRQDEIQPIRTPRGPDGTPGFDFANRPKSITAATPTSSTETS